MKTYGYLPIVKVKDFDGKKIETERDRKRFDDCITEMVAALAMVQNDDIREILTRYNASLIEAEDGARRISVGFPEKRFY